MSMMPCRLSGVRYNARGVPGLSGLVMPGTPHWQTDLARATKHSPFLDPRDFWDGRESERFLQRLVRQNHLLNQDRLDFDFSTLFREPDQVFGPGIAVRAIGGGESLEAESPPTPQIAVMRAKGKKIPNRPVWKTGDPVSSEADVVKAVKMVNETVRFFQALVDTNPVIQKYAPDFRFDLRPFIVVLDYNPAGDGKGYANASHSMTQDGMHVVLIGETPPENSKEAKYFNPIMDEAQIIFHELAHGFVAAFMAYAGHDLEYIALSGGYNEAIGDCLGGMAATQFITENGGNFLGLDKPGRLFISAQDYILGSLWAKDGTYLRNILNPGSPGRKPGLPFGLDLQRESLQAYVQDVLSKGSGQIRINRDRGGVHVFASYDNRRRAAEVFASGGNWLNVTQDLIGGLAFLSLLGRDQSNPTEATLLEMAAAFMARGETALAPKAQAAVTTGFFNDVRMPGRADVEKFLTSFEKAYAQAQQNKGPDIMSGKFDPRIRRTMRTIPS